MKISDLKGYKVVSSGTGVPEETTPAEPTSTISSRVGDVISNASQNVREATLGQGQYAGQSPVTRGIEATASAFSAVPATALAVAPEPIRKAATTVGDAIGTGFQALTHLIGSNPELQKWTQEHPEATDKILEAAKGVAASGQIAGNILLAQGAANVAQKSADISKNVASRTTNKIIDNSSTLLKPAKDVQGVVGEVLQGKTKDVSRGVNALSEIDTAGVKTFKELSNKVDDSISKLSRVVDDELSKDITTTKLSDLSTKLKTTSGNTVSTNYVDTALKHLKELYSKTGDVQGAGNIDELITHAQSTGLTKLEINDIARVYNAEFGSKAFSVTGEPLTSVNGQLYETIRKGVKAKAREGIGGEAAKAADKTVSDLYNTKTLVNKNVEAVTKLQQKIAERGLFEKAGYLVSKYADILTGGTIRGIVGGILPRGAGYKTLNALDLESRLQKNLQIIQKASKAKTDAEMTKIMSELQK